MSNVHPHPAPSQRVWVERLQLWCTSESSQHSAAEQEASCGYHQGGLGPGSHFTSTDRWKQRQSARCSSCIATSLPFVVNTFVSYLQWKWFKHRVLFLLLLRSTAAPVLPHHMHHCDLKCLFSIFTLCLIFIFREFKHACKNHIFEPLSLPCINQTSKNIASQTAVFMHMNEFTSVTVSCNLP